MLRAPGCYGYNIKHHQDAPDTIISSRATCFYMFASGRLASEFQNWAMGVFQGLRKLGYASAIACDALRPLHLPALFQLLDAPALQARQGLDIWPRTSPSARATLCTYYTWFARPQHLRRPGPLLMQPLSAHCMRVLLRFRVGAHSLPVVQGRRTGAPRAQRLCLLCDQRAVGDERHMVFECPALQGVWDKYAALFVDGASTMQQFMWQQDVIGVAHFVQDCFDLLDAPV